MYPYRVFLSYSHADRPLVERLVRLLADAGLSPLWDDDLVAGSGFSEQIQSFIANAHVFLPVLTAASTARPWVHQEIGFATALGKPILPVTLGGSPPGLISGVQAVCLREDLADAPARLSAESFRTLFAGLPDRPAIYECTEDNARRALLLARYADGVWMIRRHGTIRQVISLSTFSLPDRGAADPVWRAYFPATPDDRLLFDALRWERVALERHARAAGCRLILDPVERLEDVYRRHGPGSVRARVSALLGFLRDGSAADVVVAINDDPDRPSSLTLVGDWFSSEAVSTGRARVLREAVFTRDARTVWQQVADFDSRIQELLAARGWEAATSRSRAVAYLQTYLDSLTSRHP